MRILPGLNAAEHVEEPAPLREAAPIALPMDSIDPERLDALEKINATLLQRIQLLEERLVAIEAAPKAAPAPVTPDVPPVTVTVDAEALKKGLLSKMWKHLNDR